MKKIRKSVLLSALVAFTAAPLFAQSNGGTLKDIAIANVMAQYDVVTNPIPATNVVATNANLIPGLSGIVGVIVNQLVDDAPYVTNGKVALDFATLFNSSNPKGTGHVGEYGSITLPTTQQSAVGIGGGSAAGHTFITPVTLTVGTTLTNLPPALGRVYAFAGDGLLYDFTGKGIGNWSCAGFYKNWKINENVNLGVELGTYNDSVVPGIGGFFAVKGVF